MRSSSVRVELSGFDYVDNGFGIAFIWLPTVAAFCPFSHQGWAAKSMERDVMEDTYRCRNDTSKLKHASIR